MDIINKLPNKKAIVGTKEVIKGVKDGKIKYVVVASNCPDALIKKIPEGAKIEMFEGDQKNLGTRLGNPFFVSMAGFE